MCTVCCVVYSEGLMNGCLFVVCLGANIERAEVECASLGVKIDRSKLKCYGFYVSRKGLSARWLVCVAKYFFRHYECAAHTVVVVRLLCWQNYIVPQLILVLKNKSHRTNDCQ